MNPATREAVRHLSMRLALGFVLAWFGMHELHAPSEWGVFVPSFITHHYPGAIDGLVTLHGFLLLLAAGSVLAGVLCTGGSLLAALLLAEVVLDLWINEGWTDLVVRDLGLLGLAAALTVDPARVWHLDEWLLARLRPAVRASRHRKQRKAQPAEAARSWALRAGSGAALLAAVGAVALVLRATGAAGNSAVLDNSTVISAQGQQQQQATPTSNAPSAAATPDAPSATAAPQPAGTPEATASKPRVLFADWRHRNDAFEVYPGAITDETKRALGGFDLTLQDQGANVLLTFKALSPRYQDASITVPKTNTVYFVETSMHDDSTDNDTDLDDDGVVQVDPDGYIVQN